MQHKKLVAASVATSTARTFRNSLSALSFRVYFVNVIYHVNEINAKTMCYICESYDMVIGDDGQTLCKNHPVFSSQSQGKSMQAYTQCSQELRVTSSRSADWNKVVSFHTGPL